MNTATTRSSGHSSSVSTTEAMHGLLSAVVAALMEWTAQAAAEDEGSRKAAKCSLFAGDTQNWGEMIVGVEDENEEDDSDGSGSGRGGVLTKKRKYGSNGGTSSEDSEGEGEVRFQVGRGPVSLHLGLHRLIALLMRKLAEHNMPLPGLKALPQLLRPEEVHMEQNRLSEKQLSSSPSTALASAAASAAVSTSGLLSMPVAVGRRVRVEGLTGRKELNGSIGLAEEYHPSLRRWVVALRDGESGAVSRVRIKADNLTVVVKGAATKTSEEEDMEQPHRGGAISDDAKSMRKRFAWCLLEQPLRALSWCGQVRAGAWKRNGSPAESQAGAYGEPPLAATHRDLDLLAVQTAGLLLGAEELLRTVHGRV